MEEWNDDLLERTPIGTWAGRHVDKGPLYFYECVRMINNLDAVQKGDVVVTGYSCDEGVRRNKGRTGAVDGPNTIKKSLARTAFTSKVLDMGNVMCKDGKMEDAQQTLKQITAGVIDKGALPINIGGGHDIAFGTGSGVLTAAKQKGLRVGIVNFDAHFDLRIPGENGNSGTPFYQLAQLSERLDLDFNYLVLGIQKQSNTEDLFKTAKELKVDFVMDEELSEENIGNAIRKIVSKTDLLYVSLDLDVISGSFAPGVSAVNPLGMHPTLMLSTLKMLLETGMVCAIDIAEMNPKYDIDNRTAKLAAYMINEICRLFLSCPHES